MGTRHTGSRTRISPSPLRLRATRTVRHHMSKYIIRAVHFTHIPRTACPHIATFSTWFIPTLTRVRRLHHLRDSKRDWEDVTPQAPNPPVYVPTGPAYPDQAFAGYGAQQGSSGQQHSNSNTLPVPLTSSPSSSAQGSPRGSRQSNKRITPPKLGAVRQSLQQSPSRPLSPLPPSGEASPRLASDVQSPPNPIQASQDERAAVQPVTVEVASAAAAIPIVMEVSAVSAGIASPLAFAHFPADVPTSGPTPFSHVTQIGAFRQPDFASALTDNDDDLAAVSVGVESAPLIATAPAPTLVAFATPEGVQETPSVVNVQDVRSSSSATSVPKAIAPPQAAAPYVVASIPATRPPPVASSLLDRWREKDDEADEFAEVKPKSTATPTHVATIAHAATPSSAQKRKGPMLITPEIHAKMMSGVTSGAQSASALASTPTKAKDIPKTTLTDITPVAHAPVVPTPTVVTVAEASVAKSEQIRAKEAEGDNDSDWGMDDDAISPLSVVVAPSGQTPAGIAVPQESDADWDAEEEEVVVAVDKEGSIDAVGAKAVPFVGLGTDSDVPSIVGAPIVSAPPAAQLVGVSLGGQNDAVASTASPAPKGTVGIPLVRRLGTAAPKVEIMNDDEWDDIEMPAGGLHERSVREKNETAAETPAGYVPQVTRLVAKNTERHSTPTKVRGDAFENDDLEGLDVLGDSPLVLAERFGGGGSVRIAADERDEESDANFSDSDEDVSAGAVQADVKSLPTEVSTLPPSPIVTPIERPRRELSAYADDPDDMESGLEFDGELKLPLSLSLRHRAHLSVPASASHSDTSEAADWGSIDEFPSSDGGDEVASHRSSLSGKSPSMSASDAEEPEAFDDIEFPPEDTPFVPASVKRAEARRARRSTARRSRPRRLSDEPLRTSSPTGSDGGSAMEEKPVDLLNRTNDGDVDDDSDEFDDDDDDSESESTGRGNGEDDWVMWSFRKVVQLHWH
eukprot:Opistho-2@29484